MDERRDASKLLAVAGAGFASLLGQGALLRAFLNVFEGDELSVGLLLAFWLLWICAGAALASLLPKLNALAAARFQSATLLYIPAIALQLLAAFFARELSGVAPFEIFPFWKIMAASFAAAAPASLLTGFLFVAAGHWLRGDGVPAAKAYGAEALGSCAGALAATGLLFIGLGDAQLTLAAGAATALIALLSRALGERRSFAQTAALTLCALPLILGWGAKLDFKLDEIAFKRAVPGGSFQGAFSTRQARYLYGEREGQFIVSAWGSALECLPGAESAAPLAAEIISQAPETKRAMVAGVNSLALCLKLSALGLVREIELSSFDPEYPAELFKHLPPEIEREASKKIIPSKLDPLKLLKTENGFSLVVIRPVNMASLASIRFSSKEFFNSVKSSLKSDGVFVYFLPSGENFNGPELASFGASLYKKFTDVFPDIVLAQGDPTKIFACGKKGVLKRDATDIIARAYTIKNLASNCRPEHLREVFDEARADYLKVLFEKKLAEGGAAGGTFGPALAFAEKRLGTPELLRKILAASGLLLFSALFFHFIFRTIWLTDFSGRKGSPRRPARKLDALILLLATAAAASALFIALVARYQTARGTLAVDFGVLNALFMASAFAGTQGVESWRGRKSFVFACLALPLAALAGGLLAGAPLQEPWQIALQALLAGFLCGATVALCAGELKEGGESDEGSAAKLEIFDCLGGAAGGLVATLSLLPAGFGLSSTLPFGWALFLLCVPFLRSKAPSEPNPKSLKTVFFALGASAALVACFSASLDLRGGKLIFALGALALAGLLLRLRQLWRLKKGGAMSSGASKAVDFLLPAGALALAALALTLAFSQFKWRGAPPPPLPPLSAVLGSKQDEDDPKGKPSKIDEARIKELIKAGRLSSKDASWWIEAEGE